MQYINTHQQHHEDTSRKTPPRTHHTDREVPDHAVTSTYPEQPEKAKLQGTCKSLQTIQQQRITSLSRSLWYGNSLFDMTEKYIS